MGRRILALILLGGLVAGGVVFRAEVGDAVVGWSTRLRDLAEAEPSTEVGLRSVEGESASALIVIGSGEGDAAFALLVVDPEGPPLLVLVPQDLLVSVPGFGEFRMVDALVFGGPELAVLALVNEFGIRIDAVAAVASGALAGSLTGPLPVDLPVPLFDRAADGGVVRTLPAGPGQVDPVLVEALLAVRGEGDVFEWIQRQGAAWRSVLDAVAVEPGLADRVTSGGGVGGPAVADLLVTVSGNSESLVATIPVSRADSVLGVPSLVPARGQVDQFVRDRLDHLLLRPGGRTRVEILNGNGRIGTTGSLAGILVRAGYHLIRTDNADTFDYEETLVVAQGDHAEAAARDIIELLGRGLLFLEVRAPSGVVDVSIIVGHDIPSGEG